MRRIAPTLLLPLPPLALSNHLRSSASSMALMSACICESLKTCTKSGALPILQTLL